MKPYIFLIYLLIVLLLCSHSLQAQKKDETKERPKIGLVLSGGGAKGMAHVGVLKVMEKAGVRPDFITGTSMGSIVGGLYAIGYSAAEIETMLKAQNWNEVLSNDMLLNDININEKDQYGKYIAELPIQGVEISLPKGLIFGQHVMELLNRFTLPAHNIHDFDSLPIPFKCIGADITNADIVVLDTGSLAMAMRASMSIPTAFTPVLWGDRLLVDGGLSRNFPVQEVKEMGADIVIGVYTGGVLKQKEELKTFLDVMGQTSFLMGVIDAKKQRDSVDVYIEPNLEGYASADFAKVDSIISRGEIAGKKYAFQFDSLANLLSQYPKNEFEKEPLVSPDSLIVDEIVTRGIDLKNERFILGRFGIYAGKYFSVDELKQGIRRLYGTQYFYKIHYAFERSAGNNQRLVLYAEEKPKGFLGVNLHYDSEKRAAMLLNATFRDLLIPSTRLSLTANVSENPGFQVDYFKYFGKKRRLTVGMQFNNDAFEVPIYENGDVSRLYKYNYSNYEINSRYMLTKDSRVSVGLLFERTTVKPKVHNNFDFERWLLKNKQLYASFELNTTNKRYFPTRGISISARYEYNFDLFFDVDLVDSLESFSSGTMFNKTFGSTKFRLNYYQPMPFYNKLTLHISSHAGLTLGENFTLVKEFLAGGTFTAYSYLIPFEGFNELEYSSLQLITGGAGIQWEFFPDFYVEPRLNVLIAADYIEDFVNTEIEEEFVLGYGVQLGYASIIGPIIVNVSSNSYNNKLRSFFNVGYRFRF
jgi:NTE family protein